MKPSERIRELAEAGESHPFLVGNQARLDAIVAYLDEQHAAVPAGNQAKAPTALDEMRALSMAKLVESRPADCDHHVVIHNLNRELSNVTAERDESGDLLAESREALARVEAELKQAHRHKDDWYRAADREQGARLSLELERDELKADRDELGRRLEAAARYAKGCEAERDELKRKLEELRSQANEYGPVWKGRLADQAASEAEVTERAIVVGSKWRNKRYGHIRTVLRIIAASRDVVWDDPSGYQDCWTRESWLEMHEWVSDPEATESATKGPTAAGVHCFKGTVVGFRDDGAMIASGSCEWAACGRPMEEHAEAPYYCPAGTTSDS